MTANYVQNRLITRSIGNRSPFELWTGHKPNVSHFKLFECKAYALVSKQFRKKLDSKCKELVFVGYCEESKGFRLLNVDSNQIVISRDVEFEENSNLSNVESLDEVVNNFVFISLTSSGNEELLDDEELEFVLPFEVLI